MIVKTEINPSGRTVLLAGRFDAHEAPTFRGATRALLTEDFPVLGIDLSQVAFLDSTALAELVRLQKAARSMGGEIILIEPADAVRVILEITDLAELFTIRSPSAEPS